MIRRFRTIVIGGYVGGVYRPLRTLQIPYWIPYQTTSASEQTVTPGVGEIIIQGLQPTLALTVAVGAGEVLVTGNAPGVADEGTLAPDSGAVVITGGAVSLSLSGVPERRNDSYGSGGQAEWFERRNREDEVILAVITEWLKRAA